MGETPDYNTRRREQTPERVPPPTPAFLLAQLPGAEAIDTVVVTGLVDRDVVTSPEQRDAQLAYAQQLIEAGGRMPAIAKGLGELLEGVRAIAQEASEEMAPIPQAHVAELFNAVCDDLVAPLIAAAEINIQPELRKKPSAAERLEVVGSELRALLEQMQADGRVHYARGVSPLTYRKRLQRIADFTETGNA